MNSKIKIKAGYSYYRLLLSAIISYKVLIFSFLYPAIWFAMITLPAILAYGIRYSKGIIFTLNLAANFFIYTSLLASIYIFIMILLFIDEKRKNVKIVNKQKNMNLLRYYKIPLISISSTIGLLLISLYIRGSKESMWDFINGHLNFYLFFNMIISIPITCKLIKLFYLIIRLLKEDSVKSNKSAAIYSLSTIAAVTSSIITITSNITKIGDIFHHFHFLGL